MEIVSCLCKRFFRTGLTVDQDNHIFHKQTSRGELLDSLEFAATSGGKIVNYGDGFAGVILASISAFVPYAFASLRG